MFCFYFSIVFMTLFLLSSRSNTRCENISCSRGHDRRPWVIGTFFSPSFSPCVGVGTLDAFQCTQVYSRWRKRVRDAVISFNFSSFIDQHSCAHFTWHLDQMLSHHRLDHVDIYLTVFHVIFLFSRIKSRENNLPWSIIMVTHWGEIIASLLTDAVNSCYRWRKSFTFSLSLSFSLSSHI